MERRSGTPLVVVTTGIAAPRRTISYVGYDPNRVAVLCTTTANSGSI